MPSARQRPEHSAPPERGKDLAAEEDSPEVDVHSIFDEFDRNHNGRLETDELKVLMLAVLWSTPRLITLLLCDCFNCALLKPFLACLQYALQRLGLPHDSKAYMTRLLGQASPCQSLHRSR